MITITRDQSVIDTARQQQLATLRQEAIARINAEIGRIRGKYITPIPGQEMIYQAKEAEAVAYMASQPADLTGYPFIRAEVGVLAPSAEQVALIWLGMSEVWRQIAAILERLRMAATNTILAADSAAAIADAEAVFAAAASAI